METITYAKNHALIKSTSQITSPSHSVIVKSELYVDYVKTDFIRIRSTA